MNLMHDYVYNHCVSSYFTAQELINLGKWKEAIIKAIEHNTWFELDPKGIY